MVHDILIGNVVASKLMKTWGSQGKVTKTYGSSRSKKFDISWDDGRTTIGASTRAICFVSDLGRKPVLSAKKRKSVVQTAGVHDGDSCPDESASGSSDGDASIETELDDDGGGERYDIASLSEISNS